MSTDTSGPGDSQLAIPVFPNRPPVAFDKGPVQLVAHDPLVPGHFGRIGEADAGQAQQRVDEYPRFVQRDLRARAAVWAVAEAQPRAGNALAFGAVGIEGEGAGAGDIRIGVRLADVDGK